MLKNILEVARKSNENVLIEGKHGIGKSEQVKGYAKDKNLHLEILYLSHQEVGDLIIGTINTADENTNIDYTIRRRFTFVDVLADEIVVNSH